MSRSEPHRPSDTGRAGFTGRYRRLTTAVDVPRARARVGAFVYGNILVLAAVLASTPEAVEDGRAALVVLATTITTLIAHVFSHSVGNAIGRDLDAPRPREERVEELRDALPILSSGTSPIVVLLLAWWLGVDPGLAVLLAAATAVLRLSLTGLVVGGLSGRPPSRRQWWAGALLAVISAMIAVLKVLLTH